jgi:hypothetical protein
MRSFDEEENGNNSSQVGKQKKNMGMQDEFYLEEDLLFGYSQGQMTHTI